jgi:hypothetical protein
MKLQALLTLLLINSQLCCIEPEPTKNTTEWNTFKEQFSTGILTQCGLLLVGGNIAAHLNQELLTNHEISTLTKTLIFCYALAQLGLFYSCFKTGKHWESLSQKDKNLPTSSQLRLFSESNTAN